MKSTVLVATVCLAVAIVVLTAHRVEAGPPVTVLTHDNRYYAAQADPRTTTTHLYLRFGGGSTTILRRIPWGDIASATVEGRTLDKQQLCDLARANRTSAAGRTPVPDETRKDGSLATQNPDELFKMPASRGAALAADSANPFGSPVESAHSSQAQQARHWLAFTARVSHVRFDATLANWDQDVETDGLLLCVQPLDEHRRLVPVTGTVRAELIVNRQVSFHDVPHGGGEIPRILGRWSLPVSGQHITAEGLELRLPFTTHHAEFDTRWAHRGLLHIRLVVPGHGVFEESLDGIRVRPFAPLRDAYERNTGRRFFPHEMTGRRGVEG